MEYCDIYCFLSLGECHCFGSHYSRPCYLRNPLTRPQLIVGMGHRCSNVEQQYHCGKRKNENKISSKFVVITVSAV